MNKICILDMTSNDLEVFTNIFNFNKDLDTKIESYKVELLELKDNILRVYYVHDFYNSKGKPTFNHHIEEIEINLIYKSIENKIYKQNLFKLESKEIKVKDFLSSYLIDVLLSDEKVYFQVEDSKLKAYIRVYEWATNNLIRNK